MNLFHPVIYYLPDNSTRELTPNHRLYENECTGRNTKVRNGNRISAIQPTCLSSSTLLKRNTINLEEVCKFSPAKQSFSI